MKHLTALLILLSASTAVAQTGPICPVMDGNMGPSETDWEYKQIEPKDTTSCNARPSNRKLLSPECPTCPLLWLYPIHDGYGPGVFKADLLEAAKVWNDALKWNVIGVETGYVTMENVPTYGVTVRRHTGYTLPTANTGAFWAGHPTNINSTRRQKCYRDDIRIDPEPMSHSVLIQMIAHEIGHALVRFNWHSDNSTDLMYDTVNPIGSNRFIPADLKRLLNEFIRRPVLDGRMTLPCALRGLGC